VTEPPHTYLLQLFRLNSQTLMHVTRDVGAADMNPWAARTKRAAPISV
jgi:hypothetical protein